MKSRLRVALPVLVAVLLLAGCSSDPIGGSAASSSGTPAAGASATGAQGGSSGRIAVGAGPQAKYTVQQQPPAGSCHYRCELGEPLEDLACTPGAISPAVTQANLTSTICRKGGYTSGIRPSTSITGREKELNAASYGFSGSMRDADAGKSGYQNLRNDLRLRSSVTTWGVHDHGHSCEADEGSDDVEAIGALSVGDHAPGDRPGTHPKAVSDRAVWWCTPGAPASEPVC